jgi:hypothetical protein
MIGQIADKFNSEFSKAGLIAELMTDDEIHGKHPDIATGEFKVVIYYDNELTGYIDYEDLQYFLDDNDFETSYLKFCGLFISKEILRDVRLKGILKNE